MSTTKVSETKLYLAEQQDFVRWSEAKHDEALQPQHGGAKRSTKLLLATTPKGLRLHINMHGGAKRSTNQTLSGEAERSTMKPFGVTHKARDFTYNQTLSDKAKYNIALRSYPKSFSIMPIKTL